MKRKIAFALNLFFVLLFGVAMQSCTNEDEGTQAVTLTVNLKMPEIFVNEFTKELSVNLIKNGNVISTAQTTSGNVAIFNDVIPDVYDLSVSGELTSEEYSELTGETVQKGTYVISGTLLNQVIATGSTIDLNITVNRKQALVISKIYYAGSKDKNNKNYLAAKYIEFYNNGDEEIDIAGTYLGLVETESTPAYMIGETTDYIYLKQIFRFPNTGKTKLQPGETVLVVNSAVNHSESATREPDLTNADFEVKDVKNNNNPQTPGLDLIYTAYASITSMNMVAFCSVVLFETDEDVNSWEIVYAQGKVTGSRFVKTPVKYITDGVECLKYSTTGVDITKKRLYDYIDAGYTNIEAITGYNGQVLYRKKQTDSTSETVKLVDTNNSSNDFGISDTILPGEFE